MNLILLGAPGSGKGTQAGFISQEVGLPHIASGDLFREAQGKKTELGLLAKSYMEKGALVPDEITIRMILERIAKPDCEGGYILDGFPRTLEQAGALDESLEKMSSAIDKVICIKVSDEELLSRLSGRWICKNCQTPYHLVNSPPKVAGKCDKCGGELYQRADDNVETIKNRLSVYYTQTAPLIEYYQSTGKLVEINGEQEVERLGREIVAALRK